MAALVNGAYVLSGVVSTGTSTGGTQAICGAAGTYGVYVSVLSLNSWITAAMNESPAAGKKKKWVLFSFFFFFFLI